MHEEFEKRFAALHVPHIPSRRRRPRVSGLSGLARHVGMPERMDGLFVTRSVGEDELRRVFGGYGAVKSVDVLGRYAFVLFEDGVDVGQAVGRRHRIGGWDVYVDRIRGRDADFVPLRGRRKISLWHNRKRR